MAAFHTKGGGVPSLVDRCTNRMTSPVRLTGTSTYVYTLRTHFKFKSYAKNESRIAEGTCERKKEKRNEFVSGKGYVYVG